VGIEIIGRAFSENIMDEFPLVEILMATYNGEKYIARQIDSILAQTYNNWRLVVRDDGSTDRTSEILKDYSRLYPDKIYVTTNDGKRLGACQNFSLLLSNSSSQYIMFSDQDDVWLPGKIASSLDVIVREEMACGKFNPILVHSDLRVVDEKMEVLSDSFWKYQNLDPEQAAKFPRALIQGYVVGATCIFNKSLRDVACPIPKQAIMHDWWLVLVACAFGKILHESGKNILYRQHGHNVIGAKKWGRKYFAHILKVFLGGDLHRKLDSYFSQAATFLAIYRNRLTEKQLEIIAAFVSFPRLNFIERRLCFIKYGFYKSGFLRNVGLFLFI